MTSSTHKMLYEELKAEIKSPAQDVKDDKQEEAVLTIGVMGTAWHENKPGNLIAAVMDCVEGGPNQGKMLIGGPAGKFDDPSATPMLGTYRVNSAEFNSENGKFDFNRASKNWSDKATTAGGWIRGAGYHDAIDEIVKGCEAMMKAGKKPLTINLFGFSRGADTTLRASNILVEKFGDAIKEINIFAFDPVPGAGRSDARKACMVPSKVKEFTVMLMADETTPGFEPQDKSKIYLIDRNNTKLRFQIYPGEHGDAMTRKDKSNPMLDRLNKGVSKLGIDDLIQFLHRNKTKLTKSLPLMLIRKNKKLSKWEKPEEVKFLSKDERFDIYNEMKATEQQFSINHRNRNFLKSMQSYVLHGSDYFFDKEHQELFKEKYPSYFDYFFQCNAEQSDIKAVQADMEKIAKDEFLFATLKKARYPMAKSSLVFNWSGIKPQGFFQVATNEILESKSSEKNELSELISRVSAALDSHAHRGSYTSKAALAREELAADLKLLLQMKPDYGMNPAQFREKFKKNLNLSIEKAIKRMESYDGRLMYQLKNILGDTRFTYASYMAKKLMSYTQDYRQRFNQSPLTADRVKLASLMQDTINKVVQKKMLQQTGLLHEMVVIALHHSMRIKELHAGKKGTIDQVLHDMQLGFNSMHLTPLDEPAKAILENFKTELMKIGAKQEKLATSSEVVAKEVLSQRDVASIKPLSTHSIVSDKSSQSPMENNGHSPVKKNNP